MDFLPVGALGLVGLLVLGAWTAVDASAFLQILVSQPLVAAGLAGWIVGSPALGLGVGLLLQLLSMRALPLGGTVIPVSGPAAVVAGALAAGAPISLRSGDYAFPDAVVLAFLLLLALGLEEIGRRWVRRVRERRALRIRRAEEMIRNDELTRLPALNARGLVPEGIAGLTLTAGGLAVGAGLLGWSESLPAADPRWVVAPVLGVGLARAILLVGGAARRPLGLWIVAWVRGDRRWPR